MILHVRQYLATLYIRDVRRGTEDYKYMSW